MSDDPQLEDVREWYIAGRRTHNPFASDAGLVERFDTWLTQHDREVAAGALRDAAKDIYLPSDGPAAYVDIAYAEQLTNQYLCARADQIEEEA